MELFGLLQRNTIDNIRVLEFHVETHLRGAQNFYESGSFPLVNVVNGQPRLGEDCVLDAVQPVLRTSSSTESFHED
jgi:hypothetical protein